MGEMCRICMTEKKDLVKLVKQSSDKLERSGDKFEDCFGIKIKEIPNCQKICRKCEQTLIEFYYFKQLALRTHNYLLDKAASIPEVPMIEHCEIKEEDSDSSNSISKTEDNFEVFHIEYQDKEADELMLPLPKIDTILNFENIEIKQEKIDDDDCMASENFDEATIICLTNESLNELIADYEDNLESQGGSIENSTFLEDQQEESRERLSEKDQSADKSHKESIHDKAFAPDKLKPKSTKEKISKSDVQTALNFRCEQCNKPFMREDSYQRHMRAHQGLPRYRCSICFKGFKDKNKYEYHMKKERDERDWKCSVCEKGFLIEWDLELHMRTHTDYRPYICDICGKAFRIHCHLAEHIETHNETNLFECTICSAKLHTRKTLRGHMANAHKVGNLKYCPICNQIFVRMHRLKEHVAKYHSDVNITLDDWKKCYTKRSEVDED